MIIIKNKKDINKLKKGDNYIIIPKGLDMQNPETFIKYQEEIKNLEEAIYKIFSTEPKKEEEIENKRKK